MTEEENNCGRSSNAPFTLYAVSLVVVLGAGFTISQFLRNSTGPLVPFLAEEFSLAAGGLGLLAGGFFVSFAVAMIPTGILLDRFGPRIVMPVFMLIVALGCLVFSLAGVPSALVAGRVLMGLGCAALLMGSLTVIARWFAPSLFSTLTALIMATGNLGSLVATSPLSFAAEHWGWRVVFASSTVLALAISLTYWLCVRDAPPGHAFHGREREDFNKALRGVGEVLRTKGLWPVFAMHLVFYAVVAALVGMWGPVYLQTVHGLSPAEIGDVLLYTVAAVIAGMLVLGPCDRLFGTRKRIVLASAGGMALGLIGLATLPNLSFVGAVAAMVVVGFFGGASTVLLSHGRALFAGPLIGRGLTVVNTAVMAGVFLVQLLSGYLAQLVFPGAATITDLPVIALQMVFAFMAAVLMLGSLGYLRAHDIAP